MKINKKSKFNILIFLAIIVLEIVLFLFLSIIVSKNIYHTRMDTGSYLLFAPFTFYKETYTNSQINEQNFNILNLIINIMIIIAIAIILSLRIKSK